jgi:hypothetical protein
MTKVYGWTCPNCGLFVVGTSRHCCAEIKPNFFAEVELMKNDCTEVFEGIHEELIAIARQAARFMQKEGWPPDDEHSVRSAILQTLVNHGLVPSKTMGELEKHTREAFAEFPKA